MKCGDLNNPAGPGKKANGEYCTQRVVPGGTRCAMHGGSSPTAKYAAEKAMALLRMPAIEALMAVLERANEQMEKDLLSTCPECGSQSGRWIKAARLVASVCQKILDRTGFGPHSTVSVVPTADGEINLDLLTLDERKRLIAAVHEIKALKLTVRERMEQGAHATESNELAPGVH